MEEKKKKKEEGRICGSQKRRYRRAVKRQKVLAIRRGSMGFDALPLDFFFSFAGATGLERDRLGHSGDFHAVH